MIPAFWLCMFSWDIPQCRSNRSFENPSECPPQVSKCVSKKFCCIESGETSLSLKTSLKTWYPQIQWLKMSSSFPCFPCCHWMEKIPPLTEPSCDAMSTWQSSLAVPPWYGMIWRDGTRDGTIIIFGPLKWRIHGNNGHKNGGWVAVAIFFVHWKWGIPAILLILVTLHACKAWSTRT